jgi:hypothetical protein
VRSIDDVWRTNWLRRALDRMLSGTIAAVFSVTFLRFGGSTLLVLVCAPPGLFFLFLVGLFLFLLSVLVAFDSGIAGLAFDSFIAGLLSIVVASGLALR